MEVKSPILVSFKPIITLPLEMIYIWSGIQQDEQPQEAEFGILVDF